METRREEVTATATAFLQGKFGAGGDVETVFPLGKGEGTKSGILVRLKSLEVKKNIMRRRSELKGTTVYIDDDYTRKEREIQWKLRDIAKSEERKGRRTRVGYMKIEIGGQWRRWNEINDQLEENPFTKRSQRATGTAE